MKFASPPASRSDESAVHAPPVWRGVVRRRGSAVLVARRVYWAPLQAGLVVDRFRWGFRCIYLVARLVGLAPYCVGLVACWFGLVACFRVGGRVWLVAIFVWGLSSGVV